MRSAAEKSKEGQFQMEGDKNRVQQTNSLPGEEPTRSGEIGGFPICPVCGGVLEEIRQKMQCTRCRTIVETCCEGGRG